MNDKQLELLEKYSEFLTKNGYMDTDWQCEEPFAIDEFSKTQPRELEMKDGLNQELFDYIDRELGVIATPQQLKEIKDIAYTQPTESGELGNVSQNEINLAIENGELVDKIQSLNNQLEEATQTIIDYEVEVQQLTKENERLKEGMKCKEKNCKDLAIKDYNGHQYWVCNRHFDKLNDEFDEEYK